MTTRLASAGLIDALEDSARHLELCRATAALDEEKGRYADAAGTWQTCRDEAAARGFTDILQGLDAQVAVAQAMARNAELRVSDPNRWAQEVLAVAAAEAALDFPTDAIRTTFRAWMATVEGRAQASNVRTVTVAWNGEPEIDRARAAEVLRKHVEAMGLSWRDPGSDQVDVILYTTVELAKPEATLARQGALQHRQVTVRADHVRFRRLDKDVRGFSAIARASDAESKVATDRALQDASDLAARALLQRILVVLFRDRETP
jgi:hypothetical protein